MVFSFRHPRRIARRRKTYLLRSHSSFKYVKKRADMSTKTQNLKVPAEVKVEKHGEEFLVKARCEKDGDKLVSVLGTFDDMGVDVVQARFFCGGFFAMEATVKAEDQELDEKILSRAIKEAIGNFAERNQNS